MSTVSSSLCLLLVLGPIALADAPLDEKYFDMTQRLDAVIFEWAGRDTSEDVFDTRSTPR